MSDSPEKLTSEEIEERLIRLPAWKVVQDQRLRRVFKFPDFQKALDFVNRVGAKAEEQGHHPNICFTWGQVEIEIWTHSLGGLTKFDFRLASAIDSLADF